MILIHPLPSLSVIIVVGPSCSITSVSFVIPITVGIRKPAIRLA